MLVAFDTAYRQRRNRTMTPEADPTNLSRQVWQAVSEHALRSISGRNLCPEQSRIENLRPVYSTEEDSEHYGRQIWYFEVLAVPPSGRKQMVYGAIEFSIQYGFLELSHSVLFEDASDREQCFLQLTRSPEPEPMEAASTRLWVWAAWLSVAILTGGWLLALCRYVLANPL
jgi:hypothetical protein